MQGENYGLLLNGAVVEDGILKLDGEDDQVDCGYDDAIADLPTFSVSLWMKANELSLSRTMQMIGQRNLTSHTWSFQLWGAHEGHLTGFVKGSQANALTETVFTPAAGQWTHVVMIYDDYGDRKVHIFMNGIEVETIQQSQVVGYKIDYHSIPVTIGDLEGGGRAFDGEIDEVRIYRRVLPRWEIELLMTEGGIRRQVP